MSKPSPDITPQHLSDAFAGLVNRARPGRGRSLHSLSLQWILLAIGADRDGR